MTWMPRRCPVVLQMEVTECGAASLAMILGAHGKYVPLEWVRDRAGTSRDGVNAAQIRRAAETFGLAAKVIRCEPDDLAECPMPMILHWNFDHFVVLEKVSRGRFHLVDPAIGRCVVDRAKFGRSFTGVCLIFDPSDSFERNGRAPSLLSTLIREARHSPDAMVVSAALGLVASLPGMAFSGAVGIFTDHIAGKAHAGWMGPLVAGLVGIALAQGMLAVLSGRVSAALRAKIATHTALRAFWHALTLPIAFFQQRSAGELVGRLRLGSDVGGAVAGPLANVVPNLAQIAIYLGVLTLFHVWIAMAAAVVGLVNCLALTGISRLIAQANRRLQIADGQAAGVVAGGLLAFPTYRLHGREDLLRAKLISAENAALDAEQRMGWLTAIAGLVPMASGLVLSTVALILTARLVMIGDLSLGAVLSIQTMTGLLATPVAALAGAITALQQTAGALTRVGDLLDHPVDAAFTADRPRRLPDRREGKLTFANVRYDLPGGRPLLNAVDFAVAPGELVAIIGPSGSGKSTIARLAAGLVASAAGAVTLDDIPLADWPADRLRDMLQYVPQSAAVFTGTIEENVTLGCTAIGLELVTQVLATVGLEGAISQLPAGLDTPISPTRTILSGGELQRLMLARALVRRPRILVLDETTSALDTFSEANIMAHLRSSGMGVLIATHRSGTAQRCDRIYRVEGGCLHPGLVAVRPVQPDSKLSIPELKAAS